MRSARCRGVYASGEAKRARPAAFASTGRPHCPQKRTPSASSAPHEPHESVSRAPHSVQKRLEAGVSCWQRGQCMAQSLGARREEGGSRPRE